MSERQLEVGDIVGLFEAAQLLGVSDGAISHWLASDATFPAPVKVLKSTRLWSARELLDWQVNRPQRKAGRPRKPSAVERAQEAVELTRWERQG